MTEPATPPVLTWLRLEGLAVAALAAVLYWRTGTSWWLFAALWLVPDVSMIGFLANPRIGSWCYNSIHSYLLPIALLCLGLSQLVGYRPMMMGVALIWFNHIGVDRALGYGIKYPTGFGITHLKHMGKSKPTISD
jgi:hypothetical protein